MKQPIHITAVRKDPPDLDRFVAALLALAIARVEERQAPAKRDTRTDRTRKDRR
jgi:hypothetical protein